MNLSVAIVTGASQGIGRATVIHLASDFKCLVLAARSEDGLRETAQTVQLAGVELLTLDLWRLARPPFTARASAGPFDPSCADWQTPPNPAALHLSSKFLKIHDSTEPPFYNK